ncbi:MAG: CapA family protein [bacterium]|nr:CapA family protein [bacterium]MDY4108785.1 CapA family protein [Bacilli bacterium]
MRRQKRSKRPFILLLSLIIMIFGSLYLFKGFFKKDNGTNDNNDNDNNNNIVENVKERSITFTLAGNVLLNAEMWYDTASDGQYNFEYVFEDINNIMKKSNVNFYTQQGILGGKDLGLTSYTNFNTPYDTATELAKVGFNTISLASYHANDRGVQGITNAINFLNENKISYSGISLNEEDRLKNSIIEKNGIKVALLGYTMGSTIATNNTYSVSIYSEEQVKKDYDSIKDQADIIMVAIDYSNNRSLEVTEQEKNIANYLANLGVDIVIGNTGYSVQPIEKINNTLVFYSLGNMLSGHSLTDNKISAIVDFKYTIKEKGGNIEKNYDDINVLLTYAYSLNGVNYKVVPFTKIQTELNDYKIYYEKYNKLLTENNKNVKLYPIGE